MEISLGRLGTKDLATLAQRMINTIQSGKYAVIAGHPLTAALQSAYGDYDEVYTKQTYSGKGKDVAAADLERDEAYSNMKAFLNAYRKMTLVPHYQAAEDLYSVFKSFGLDLDRQSYSSQSAQMKKLIEALESTENQQKINALSLTATFADLKTKYENFETVFAGQAEANADLRTMPSGSGIPPPPPKKKKKKNHKTSTPLLPP